jgi:hypothetical protein
MRSQNSKALEYDFPKRVPSIKNNPYTKYARENAWNRGSFHFLKAFLGLCFVPFPKRIL